MGLFDSVYVRCERCGKDVEFQSKAGECSLSSFDIHNAPYSILGDIGGQTQECECGNPIKINVRVVAWTTQEGK